MAASFEKIVKGCNSMADFRAAISTEQDLGDAWAASMAPVMRMLSSRCSRLQWCVNAINTFTAASEQDIMKYNDLLSSEPLPFEHIKQPKVTKSSS